MKRITIALCFLVLIKLVSYGQGFTIDAETIKLGWNIASPFIVTEIKDPLTKEIVLKTVPKLIDQDVKGAVYEVSNSFYKIKGVKVLNKEFLTLLENSISKGVQSLKNKEYITAVNNMIEIVMIGESYFSSGLLNSPDKRMSNAPTINNSIMLKESTLNEKMYVSAFNYLFFVDNGTLNSYQTITQEIDEGEEVFNITTSTGFSYILNINYLKLDEPIYIETLKSNKSEQTSFNNNIKELLQEVLGPGSVLKSEYSNDYNFSSIDYTYSYNDIETGDAFFAKAIFAVNGLDLYVIIFKTPAQQFTVTKEAFNKLMNNFYIVGIDETKVLLDCEINKTGDVTFLNNSTNPYDVFLNGYLKFRLAGKESKTISVATGNLDIYTKQVSGYAFYPTETTEKMNIIECEIHYYSFP